MDFVINYQEPLNIVFEDHNEENEDFEEESHDINPQNTNNHNSINN